MIVKRFTTITTTNDRMVLSYLKFLRVPYIGWKTQASMVLDMTYCDGTLDIFGTLRNSAQSLNAHTHWYIYEG